VCDSAQAADREPPSNRAGAAGPVPAVAVRHGAGAAIIADGGLFELGRLEWRLSPFSLLLLSPRLDVESRWVAQLIVGDFALSRGGQLRIRDASISVSAGLLQRFLPVQLEGVFNLQLPGITLENGLPVAGEGRLVWQQARWFDGGRSRELGDYVLQFHVDEQQQLQGNVSTLSGPIEAHGKVQLAGRAYGVDLHLRSKAPFAPELRNALQLIASPEPGGFHVKLDSEF
jgi:general secretion pathway protein N